jgi:hypothetical protein
VKYLLIAGAVVALIALKLTKLAVIFGLIALIIFLIARSGIFRKIK